MNSSQDLSTHLNELTQRFSKYLDNNLTEETEYTVQVHYQFNLAEEVYNDMGAQAIYIHQYPCGYKYAVTTCPDPSNNPNDYTIVVEDKTFDKIVLSKVITGVMNDILFTHPVYSL